MKKGLSKILVTSVLITITIVSIVFFYNIINRDYKEEKKAYRTFQEKTRDSLVVNVIYPLVDNQHFMNAFKKSISCTLSYFEDGSSIEFRENGNFEGDIYFIFYPINEIGLIKKIEGLLRSSKKKVFFYSFLTLNPNLKCTDPNNKMLWELFRARYIEKGKEGCVSLLYGDLVMDEFFALDDLGNYKKIDVSDKRVRVVFVKSLDSNNKILLYGVKGNQKYPLIIQRQNNLLITFKMCINKDLDKYALIQIKKFFLNEN